MTYKDVDVNITVSPLISYTDISDKPSLNGTLLNGKLTSNDVGVQPLGDYATQISVDGKQDKLTAGNNITISSDNVISSTGGGSEPTNMVTTDTDQTITGLKTFDNHINLLGFNRINFSDKPVLAYSSVVDNGEVVIGSNTISSIMMSAINTIKINREFTMYTNVDSGNISTYALPKISTYAFADIPVASTMALQIVYVSDRDCLAFSNGTKWIQLTGTDLV